MNDVTPAATDEQLAKAAQIGAEHGKEAASWYFDGNTTIETYARVFQGIEDGDPEVYDTFPSADFSGEWADAYSTRQLFEDSTGLDAHAESTWNYDRYLDAVEALMDSYSVGWDDAVQDTVRTAAYGQVHGRACSVCGDALHYLVEKHWQGWLDETGDGLSYAPHLHDHTV